MIDKLSMENFFNWAQIEKDGLIEYRTLKLGKDGNYINTLSSYAHDRTPIIEIASKLPKDEMLVVGVNPRPEIGKNKDKDIVVFKNVYLDIEPIHEKNSICTPEQLLNFQKFTDYLVPKFKATPICAFSGNGCHLWWALPNTIQDPLSFYDHLKWWYDYIIEKTKEIREKYAVRIDQTLSPSRQVKLYGTAKPIPGSQISTFPCFNRMESPKFIEYILSLKPTKTQITVNPIEDIIPHGQRNNTLVSLAGSMRKRGMTEEEIFETLKIVNSKRCNPPVSDKELEAISKSISKYPPDNTPEVKVDSILFSYTSLQNFTFPEVELMPTGIACLDEYFSGGLGKKEVSMFIAPQETGKTTLACAIGAYVALGNRTILHIFYEDEPKVIKERYDSLNRNNINLNVYFVDSTKRAIWLDKIDEYIRKVKPELVIIDYFARIPGVSTDRFKAKEALEWFGNIARQNNCHILILDHVTVVNNPNDTSYIMREHRVSESKMYKLAIVNYMVGFMKDRHNDDIIYLTGMKAKRKAKKLFKSLQVDRDKCIFTDISGD